MLSHAGFYASFSIPKGVEEGRDEWSTLVEKEVGQAFYGHVLVPMVPSVEAYMKSK